LKNLENKDSDFIIKRTEEFIKLLIEKINKQTVYELFVVELDKIKNKEFVIKIINILNNYLLTSNNAKILKYNGIKSNEFFKMLFNTWSKNSLSCLILCLIAEDFELSYNLLKNFGKIKLNKDDLKEYSQIIQIFESKEFTSK
jgi:vacuole morphology and inheritance protein 14